MKKVLRYLLMTLIIGILFSGCSSGKSHIEVRDGTYLVSRASVANESKVTLIDFLDQDSIDYNPLYNVKSETIYKYLKTHELASKKADLKLELTISAMGKLEGVKILSDLSEFVN